MTANFAREKERFESGKRRFPPLIAQLFGYKDEFVIVDAVDWRPWSTDEGTSAGYHRALIRSAAASITRAATLPDALRFAAKLASVPLDEDAGAARALLLQHLGSVPNAELPELPEGTAAALREAGGLPPLPGEGSAPRRPARERRPAGVGLQSAALRPFCSWEHEEFGPPVFDPAAYALPSAAESASAAAPAAAVAGPASAQAASSSAGPGSDSTTDSAPPPPPRKRPASSAPTGGRAAYSALTPTHRELLQEVGWARQASFGWWPCIVVHPATIRGLPKALAVFAKERSPDRVLVRYFDDSPVPSFFAVSAAKSFRKWQCPDHDDMVEKLLRKDSDMTVGLAAAAAEHAKPIADRLGSGGDADNADKSDDAEPDAEEEHAPATSSKAGSKSMGADEEAARGAAAPAKKARRAPADGALPAAEPRDAAAPTLTGPVTAALPTSGEAEFGDEDDGDVVPSAARASKAKAAVPPQDKAGGKSRSDAAGQKRRRARSASPPEPSVAESSPASSSPSASSDDDDDSEEEEDERVRRPARGKGNDRITKRSALEDDAAPAAAAPAATKRRAAVAAAAGIKAKVAAIAAAKAASRVVPPAPPIALEPALPDVSAVVAAPALAVTMPEDIACADALAARIQANLADPAALLALLDGPLTMQAVSVALLRASRLLPCVRQHLVRYTAPLPSQAPRAQASSAAGSVPPIGAPEASSLVAPEPSTAGALADSATEALARPRTTVPGVVPTQAGSAASAAALPDTSTTQAGSASEPQAETPIAPAGVTSESVAASSHDAAVAVAVQVASHATDATVLALAAAHPATTTAPAASPELQASTAEPLAATALALRIRNSASILVERWKKACVQAPPPPLPRAIASSAPSVAPATTMAPRAAAAAPAAESKPTTVSSSSKPAKVTPAPPQQRTTAAVPKLAASSAPAPTSSFRDFMKQALGDSSAATASSATGTAQLPAGAAGAPGDAPQQSAQLLLIPENAALWAAWRLLAPEDALPSDGGGVTERRVFVDVLTLEFMRAVETSRALEAATAGMSSAQNVFTSSFAAAAARSVASVIEARLHAALVAAEGSGSSVDSGAYCLGARAALLHVVDAVDAKLRAHHEASGRLGGGITSEGLTSPLRHTSALSGTAADLVSYLLEVPSHARSALGTAGAGLLASAQAAAAAADAAGPTQPPATDASGRVLDPYAALKRDAVCLLGPVTGFVAEGMSKVAVAARAAAKLA